MAAPPPILALLADKCRGPLAHLFDSARPLFLRSAPGRIDALGGLAAETGGTLAQMALPRRAVVALQTRGDDQLVFHSEQIAPPLGDSPITIRLASLLVDARLRPTADIARALNASQHWATPLVAAWIIFYQHAIASPLSPGQERIFGGFTFAVDSQLAMNAGQASSTAVVAAAMLGMIDATGQRIDAADLPHLVHKAEHFFAPNHSHVVDALTVLSAMEAPPVHLLRYSAQPYQLVGQVAVPKDLRMVAFDTGVRYTAANQTVESLRLAGAMGLRIIETIYRDLGQRHTPLHGYLANTSPSLYRQYFRSLLPRRMRGSDFVRSFGDLPQRAGLIDPGQIYRVRTAVDHLISEHEYAENFLQAIEELSDPFTIRQMPVEERQRTRLRAGRLLLASHHSYRLRLELSCREADWLVDALMEAGPDKGIFGARITASGGGGTVVALMDRSRQSTDALLQAVSAFSQLSGLHLQITEAGSPGSAGAVLTGPFEVAARR